MERSESIDEFFGDQSSESGSDHQSINESSKPYGAAAHHDYRSRESSIKTLSYLDGFDETKEEKLQDGFCDGYKQAFRDAFGVGRQLGSLSAKVALDQFLIPNQQTSNDSSPGKEDSSLKSLHYDAELIHQFLTDKVLTGSADKEKDGYVDALMDLCVELEKSSPHLEYRSPQKPEK